MATPTTEVVEPTREQSLSVRLIPFIDRYGVLLIVLIMVAVSFALEPTVFLSWRNISNIFRQIAFNALLALGEFIVIVTAGIDLSVGSMMGLSAVEPGPPRKASVSNSDLPDPTNSGGAP